MMTTLFLFLFFPDPDCRMLFAPHEYRPEVNQHAEWAVSPSSTAYKSGECIIVRVFELPPIKELRP